jgi:CHAD domain-containing protein
MARHREVERKFDSDADTPLPDLTGLAGGVGEGVATDLDATYFDTAELRLARHGVTLRRRTGGADAGWHLKLPVGGDERLEVRRPLGRATRTVPAALLKEVRALARDAQLVPVARLRTTRVEHTLLGSDGASLAVVADDTVRAERLAGDAVEVSTWREVEVELVDGDRRLLDEVGAHLRRAGLQPSAASSKLARVLGTSVPAAAVDGQRGAATVGDVLRAHLREQVGELLARDRGARVDEPDAVHKMRVAARRLRSALATYRPILDRTRTDPIRDELKWLGQVLGRPRDAEVLRDRLRAMVADQPGELVLGPVVRRIDLEMNARHRAAHAAAVQELEGERYFRLLDALDALVEDPPLTVRADEPATQLLPVLVRRAVRRVDRAARAVDTASTAEARDAHLHEVRKSAKRARYAAESAMPVIGRPAKRLAKRMEAVQELLGEHQDSVTSRGVIRELGVAAHLAGENGFTFGLLHEVEHERAERARAGYPEVLRKASRPKVRAWLRT